MKNTLPTRVLPSRPDLGQLRRQAKELLHRFQAGDPHAVAEVQRFYREAGSAPFSLHQAQLVLARSYGYDSWPQIRAYVDGVTGKRLADVVRAGDLQQARAILRKRPELVNSWSDFHTPLHYAVLERNPEITRMLMAAGANPHAWMYPYRDATTSYALAEERGYSEIVVILQEEERKRATDRLVASDLPRVFHQAIHQRDEVNAVAILKDRPELVHFVFPDNGRTLLHLASALLLRELAVWLIKHGADVHSRMSDGSTPLDLVGRGSSERERMAGVPEMIALLRTHGAEVTARSAVILGDKEYLRREHIAGSLAKPRDEEGWLLRLAVDYNRPDVLQLLLEFGLDPDAKVQVGDPDEIAFTWGMPLYHCVRQAKHEMAEVLLRHGADPNGQVYASGTPLSEAYGQRDTRMIALLERYGGESNPNMAGLYRRKDLAEALLARHGDAKLPDDGFGSGTVAEQLVASAARGGDPEILRMGLERIALPPGDERWHGLLRAPLAFWNHGMGPWCHQEWDRSTYLACFNLILERSGPPVGRYRHGTTILHEIVTMGDHVHGHERVEFAKAALDAGARLDFRDDLLKSTPLGWACRWRREELVQLFLGRGASPLEVGAEPWATPLAWAEKKGHEGIARMLRDRLGLP